MAEPADSAAMMSPNVRRVVAPNPSPMTGAGTNSYLVGVTDLVAIDPGPDDPTHLGALATIADGRLRYILVTHAHRDHAPGAAALRAATGATVLGFGKRDGFTPDGELTDGDLVRVPGVSLRVLYTPGHSSDHLCYLLGSATEGHETRYLFSGDLVLGGTTTAISPLDGNMAAYLSSLERLVGLGEAIEAIAPGHGEVIDDPAATFARYLAHRRARELEVIGELEVHGAANTTALADAIYPGLDTALRHAARATLWAHLRKLADEGVVVSDQPDDPDATWRVVSKAETLRA